MKSQSLRILTRGGRPTKPRRNGKDCACHKRIEKARQKNELLPAMTLDGHVGTMGAS
jgi:hypothetical protein